MSLFTKFINRSNMFMQKQHANTVVINKKYPFIKYLFGSVFGSVIGTGIYYLTIDKFIPYHINKNSNNNNNNNNSNNSNNNNNNNSNNNNHSNCNCNGNGLNSAINNVISENNEKQNECAKMIIEYYNNITTERMAKIFVSDKNEVLNEVEIYMSYEDKRKYEDNKCLIHESSMLSQRKLVKDGILTKWGPLGINNIEINRYSSYYSLSIKFQKNK